MVKGQTFSLVRPFQVLLLAISAFDPEPIIRQLDQQRSIAAWAIELCFHAIATIKIESAIIIGVDLLLFAHDDRGEQVVTIRAAIKCSHLDAIYSFDMLAQGDLFIIHRIG